MHEGKTFSKVFPYNPFQKISHKKDRHEAALFAKRCCAIRGVEDVAPYNIAGSRIAGKKAQKP